MSFLLSFIIEISLYRRVTGKTCISNIMTAGDPVTRESGISASVVFVKSYAYQYNMFVFHSITKTMHDHRISLFREDNKINIFDIMIVAAEDLVISGPRTSVDIIVLCVLLLFSLILQQ